ncbi:RNA-binding protein 8A [Aphelenchoides bicaudatus]|nr:RNA-binding protein 8A [Aphelenchoides bicaudatus]
MSDNEINVDEVHEELEQLKQSAKRKKGRGFTNTEQGGDTRGDYETLKGEGPGPQRSVDGWTIFVTGINEEAKVLNMHLNLDRRTGYLKGYCVAQYETKEEAASAIRGLDDQEFVDRVLHADWAFLNTKRR